MDILLGLKKIVKRFTGAFGMVLTTGLVAYATVDTATRIEVVSNCFNGTAWPSGMLVIMIIGSLSFDAYREKQETIRTQMHTSEQALNLKGYENLVSHKPAKPRSR